jgi:hypothetical protein
VPGNWTIEIAKHIKSKDSNHLVLDGSYLRSGISKAALYHPSIDVLSNHYYDDPYDPKPVIGEDGIRVNPKEWTFSARIQADVDLVSAAGKPFFIGETGLEDISKMKECYEALKNNDKVSGAMV